MGSSATGHPPRSRPRTTVTSLSPMRHEKPNPTSLHQTQADSVLPGKTVEMVTDVELLRPAKVVTAPRRMSTWPAQPRAVR